MLDRDGNVETTSLLGVLTDFEETSSRFRSSFESLLERKRDNTCPGLPLSLVDTKLMDANTLNKTTEKVA